MPNLRRCGLLASLFLALVLGACVVRVEERDGHRPLASSPRPVEGSTGLVAAPVLVDVDANQTMEAIGGDGVGVFVEYRQGGHWLIRWTCDTNRTRETCAYALKIRASTPLANVQPSNFRETDAVVPIAPNGVDVRARTSTELQSLEFDLPAGEKITVDASVGGLREGSFFFFVQRGQVNGGYAGKLTNPLSFQGNPG